MADSTTSSLARKLAICLREQHEVRVVHEVTEIQVAAAGVGHDTAVALELVVLLREARNEVDIIHKAVPREVSRTGRIADGDIIERGAGDAGGEERIELDRGGIRDGLEVPDFAVVPSVSKAVTGRR